MPLQSSLPKLKITLTEVAAAIQIKFAQPDSFSVPVSPFGSGGGISVADLPTFDSRHVIDFDDSVISVPCDSVTPAHIQAQRAIDRVRNLGGGILYFVGDDPSKRFYFNASVSAKNKVVCVWINEILFGDSARLGIMGALDTGNAGDSTYYLSADIAINDNQFHPQFTGQAAEFHVGDVLEFRGENDENGVALDRQRVTVTAVNLATGWISVSPAFQSAFAVSYPLSQYAPPPTGIDRTTVVIVTQATLITLTEGVCDVQVSDASKFGIGDIVVIDDAKLCIDVDPTSTANQIHMETNIVRNVDTVANIVTLQLPLSHTYEAAFNPKMTKTAPARRAAHINPRIFFAARSKDNNRHAMLLLFAYQCVVSGLVVQGEPNVDPLLSLGNRGHGCRISDGCINNWIDRPTVNRPAFWAAGQGYGVTCYNGARANRIHGATLNGCRHSVLFFKGASDNVVTDVISIDCRGTDIDFHGANETRNTVDGVKLIGGSSVTDDINIKAGIKFGNQSHKAGPRGNVVRNVDVTALPYYVAHWVPSSDNHVIGVRGSAARGALWQRDAESPTLTLTGAWLIDAEFIGGTKHIDVDGGANKIVDRCGARNVTVRDAPMSGTSIDLANAGRFTLDECKSLNAQNGISSYLIQASGVTGLSVRNFRGDGAKRFLSLTNCPNAVIESPRLSNLSERVALYDAAGNDNTKFLDFECDGFDPVFIDQAAPSAGIIKTPRRMASKRIDSALALPAAFLGSAAPFVLGTTAPLDTAGTQILTGTFKPRVPKGKIAFRAFFQYIWIDATNELVCAVWARKVGAGAWTFVGWSVARPTTGATAGSGLIVEGEYSHAIEDMSQSCEFKVMLGCNNTGAVTFTVGDRMGGGAPNVPFLQLREVDPTAG